MFAYPTGSDLVDTLVAVQIMCWLIILKINLTVRFE